MAMNYQLGLTDYSTMRLDKKTGEDFCPPLFCLAPPCHTKPRLALPDQTSPHHTVPNLAAPRPALPDPTMTPTNGPSGTAGIAPAMQLGYCVPVPCLTLPSHTMPHRTAPHRARPHRAMPNLTVPSRSIPCQTQPGQAIRGYMSNEAFSLESTVLWSPVTNADNGAGNGKPVVDTGGINHRPFNVQRNNR